jgi:spermidine synthase
MKFFTENEPTSPINARYRVSRVLYRGRSKYQKILVFDSPFHGRVLVLDDIVQLTTREEFLYHEMLVHPVLQAHPDPRKVLIIGGGDGGTLREVVKYPSVEKVVECELDEQVVNVARKYLPKVAAGYKDKRAELRFEDGKEFIKQSGEMWDAILLDLTDPIGPAKPLFERPFYKLCAEHLTENGLLCAQTESLHFHRELVKMVTGTLCDLFACVELVTVPLSMYPGNWWTFTVASKSLDPKRARNPFTPTTRVYSRADHAWFFLPAGVREKILG